MIDKTKEDILRYIFAHPGVSAKVLLRDLFEGNREKQSFLYRRLSKLLDLGYIKTSLMYPEKGAASPKLYFLTLRGAHIIGEKMPRDHAKFQRRDFRKVERIRSYVASLAKQRNWYLIEENEDCRAILAGELKKAAIHQYGKAEPDYIYLNQIPHKIEPDVILYTGEMAYIVIISHPHAGRGAFKDRIKRYERLIYFVEFICFPLNENQRTQWIDVLREYDYYHKTAYKDRFHIKKPAEIEEIA